MSAGDRMESTEAVLEEVLVAGRRADISRFAQICHGQFSRGSFDVVQLSHVFFEIKVPAEPFLTNLQRQRSG